MRIVVSENEAEQIQSDCKGIEYVYRKDYLYKGTSEEYSLALMYARTARHEQKQIENPEPVLPLLSERRGTPV